MNPEIIDQFKAHVISVFENQMAAELEYWVHNVIALEDDNYDEVLEYIMDNCDGSLQFVEES